MRDVLRTLKLLVIMVLAIPFLAVLAAIAYLAYMWATAPPPPPPTPAEIARMEQWAQFWHYAGMTTITIGIVAAAGMVLRFLIIPALNDRERVPADKDTGLYPAVVRNVTRLNQRLHGEQQLLTVNPNLSTSAAQSIRMNGTDTNTPMPDHAATPDLHMKYADGSWKVQTTAARYGRQVAGGRGGGRGPTVAEMKAQSGVYDAERRRKDAQAELAEQRRDRYVAKIAPTEEPRPASWPRLDINEAMRTVTPTQFALGQDQVTGELVHWDVVGGAAHMRIHGETQSGKTTLQMAIAVQMVGMKWHVLVCDRRRFKDWGLLDGHVQLIDTRDPRILAFVLQELWKVHDQRDGLVAQRKAGNIDELPADERPTRIGLVLDEWGAQATVAAEDGVDIQTYMRILAQEGASNGIHLLFGDQKPMSDTWDSIMRANVGAKLVGHLDPDSSRNVIASDIVEGVQRTYFHYNKTGRILRGWPIREYIGQLLAGMPPHTRQLVPVAGYQRQLEAQDGAQQTHGGGQKSSPKWEEAMAWLQRHPNETQAEMIEALDGTVSRGYCNRAYRAFHDEPEQ